MIRHEVSTDVLLVQRDKALLHVTVRIHELKQQVMM